MAKLPKTVYVHWEELPSEDDYLVADNDIEGHIGKVGVYRLQEVVQTRSVTEVRKKDKGWRSI